MCHFHWKWGHRSCSVSASPDSTLCFILLAASQSCWACVQWQRVQSNRASEQPWTIQHREVHNTEKKVLFATCAAPVPRYTRHDLLSLETAATPPPSLSPQLIAHLSHLGIARNVPRIPHRSRRGAKNERRKIKLIVGFRDRLPSDSLSCPTPCRQPAEVDFYHFSSAPLPDSKHWFTTSFLQPLPYLVTP